MKKKSAPTGNILSKVFSVVEAISPKLVARLALYLFLKPIRFKRPAREEEVYKKAKKTKIKVNSTEVTVFEWGKGPIIYLMHGWSGRATQFAALINELSQNYRVISADAPGHGESKGSKANVIIFTDTLLEMHRTFGHARAFIGHSLGSAAGMNALGNGLVAEKYVGIAPPVIAQLILEEGMRKMGADEKNIPLINELVRHKTGKEFRDFTNEVFALHAPEIDYKIVHDNDDKETNVAHAKKLESLLPQAEFTYTDGLGHVRILRDPKVIENIKNFISR